MKKALTAITTALGSLALAAPAFAATIGVDQPDQVKITDLGKLISSSVSVIIIVAGILIFVFLVWGGIEWLTSGGDKAHVENAQKRITNALIGLAIIAAAWALSQIITTFFGVQGGLGGQINLPTPY